MSQEQYSSVQKCHIQDTILILTVIHCNLGIILEHPDQHTAVRRTLAFYMIFLVFFIRISVNLKTRIRNLLFCNRILTVYIM